jgi:hypothetical protein
MSVLYSALGRIAAAFALALTLTLPARAELAQPTGEAVLTVNGAIAQTNSEGAALFDMEMLQALPAVEFTTTTQWTEGPQTFKGVPLKALLESLGATGTKITATALNNYSVEIPVDALKDDVPIVAYTINGETFSRRDKGPLWIVFPYDSGPDYQTELVFGWSIWQLATLSVSE